MDKFREKKTPIVNVKVANIRPNYDNLKEWIKDPNNVYIGRRGVVFVTEINPETGMIGKKRFPAYDSIWANPFKIGKDGDREEVLRKYKEYITIRLDREPQLLKELAKLKGKNLGCWCYPDPCHGDILKEIMITKL
ncbi:MAG: hypothetical protein CBD97_01995 [Pelagibacteraceae bacterium TMED237]|nr:MAG: hypothetical protein CBD97_01995 [Pelagibacteraceae bacterium TMED237]|tara:strand:+ start:3929 stop:4336 length:408 start_codon:yes stop_codon:yes gene_type:complete